MALTITSLKRGSAGNRRASTATVAFDSSYPTGGESLTPQNLGLHSIEQLDISSRGGYDLDYDYSNQKLKAFKGSVIPPLVVEEAVTVASNVGTLAYKPSYIVAVESVTGTTTGNFKAIASGATPLTTQVALTMSTGTLTFLSTDAVTAARVTYFPVRTGTIFTEPTTETVVASSSKVNLSARAAAIQLVYDATNGTTLQYIPPGEAPGSGECAIDINDSGNTSIDTNADIDDANLTVVYLPYANLDNATQFVDDTDLTLSSEAYDFVGDGHIASLQVPGLGTTLCGETGAAANVELNWAGPSASVGAGVAVWDPAINKVSTDEATAITTLAIPWLRLNFLFDSHNFLPEVVNGSDLSGLTGVRVRASGT